MILKTPIKRVLLNYVVKPLSLGVLGILFFFVTNNFQTIQSVNATSNSTINFQARLMSISGALVPDGNYNVEFKLYSASSGGTALWTEDWLNINNTQGTNVGVRVQDGYLTANLGTVTAFPGTITWNQQLWLTVNIGGTTIVSYPSITWDGEMLPRIQLTATPYSIAAGQLSTYNNISGYSAVLQFTPPNNGQNDTITLPDASGTVCLQSSSSCGFVTTGGLSGSAFIQNGNSFGTAAVLGTNDNNSLLLRTDGSTAVTILSGGNVGIGTSGTPAALLSVGGTTGNFQVNSTGSVTIQTTNNSATAFQVNNAAGEPILNVDTTTNNLISNPGFEVNITGWAAVNGAAAPVRNTNKTYVYHGQASLQETTSTTANSGVQVTGFTSTLTYPVTYTLSFYVMGGSAFSDLEALVVGGGAPTCTLNSANVVTTGFQRYYCTFTTASSNVTAITIGESGTTSHVFYLDAAQLNSSSTLTPYNIGNIQLRGVVNAPATFQSVSNSTTAFQIQNAAGTSNLFVADTLDNQITIGGNAIVNGQVNITGSNTGSVIGTLTASALDYQIITEGSYAYALIGLPTKIQAYDISNPASPNAIGTAVSVSNANWLAIAGHYAYVGGSTGIQIFDISNPYSITLVGNLDIGDTVFGVSGIYAPGGSFIYADIYTNSSTGTNILQPIDVSNPSNPVAVGTPLSLPAWFNWCSDTGQGRYLYVATGNNYFWDIFDLSNPLVPSVIYMSGTGYNVAAMTAQGRYAYVLTNSTVQAWDISNPASPVTVGTAVATSSTPMAIYLQGHYIYVLSGTAASTDYLQAISISNPAQPALSWTISTGYYGFEYGTQFAVQGNYAYIGDGVSPYYFQAINLGGTYTQSLQAGSTETTNLQVDANENISGNSSIQSNLTVGQGLQVTGSVGIAGRVNIGGNGTPTSQLYVSGTVPTTSLGTISTNLNDPSSVFVQGNYAYIDDAGTNQLVIDNVSNPASPAYVGETTGSYINGPNFVYVQGNYAYVASGGTVNELVIYNISNPASPTYVGKTTGSYLSNPASVYVQGSYAYVASAFNGEMVIYNISNPASPTYVGEINTGYSSGAYFVYVQGSYAYVVNYSLNELIIYNISNPASPTYVGKTTGGYLSGPYSVYVQGSYAYVASEVGGALVIYNISNPASPAYVGQTNYNLSGAYSVYVQGRYAYVTSSNNNELVIDDVSNPANPTYVGEVGTSPAPDSVYVSGRYAYVVDDSSSPATLQIFDLGGSYIQQLQVGGIETGTLQVDSNSILNGDANIAGGITVGSNADVNGNAAVGGLSITDGLTTPAAPTLTVTTAGTTSYSYAVAATNTSGSSAVSSNTSTSLAAATLNTTTAYIRASWSGLTGASAYNVYRTAGGAAQGLIGTVSNTSTLTPSGFSMTGTVLTLTFSSTPPPWSIGQAITLSGFTSSPTSVNGTWPITGVTATTVTINITSGATSTETVMGTAQGILGFFDMAQTAGSAAPTIATAGTFLLQTTSTTAFQVQNAAGSNILSVNTTNGLVNIGTPYGGSATPLNGALVLNNSTTANTVTLTSGATTASYSIALPTAAPTSTGLCLQDSTSGSNTQLAFASCSTVNTSITEVYENDNHTTPANPTSVSNTPQNVGDVLVLMAEESGTSTITGVSGGDVTTWTEVNVSPASSPALRTEMWMGVITSTSGTPSVSVTYNTTPTSYEDAVMEFTAANVNSNSTWGVNSTGVLLNPTASTTITYPTLTSEGASEIYVGYAQSQAGGSAGSYQNFSYKVTGGSNVITYVSPTSYNTPYTPTASQLSGESNTVAAILVAFVNSTSINNNTLTQQGNFNVQAASSGSVAGVLQANASGSGDILDLLNGSGTKVATVGNTGNALFEASTNSTTALQVQSSSATVVLNANTSNNSINTDQLASPGTITTTLAPTTPTLATGGTAGSTSYSYAISAVDPNGATTLVSPIATIGTGNATLSSTNYIKLSWTAVSGAINYNVYRTANGANATNIGLIGTTPTAGTSGSPFDDIGQTAASNTSTAAGSLSNSTTYYFEVTAIDGTGGQTKASSPVNATATTGTNLAITLSWAPVTGARGYDVYYGSSYADYITTYTNNYTYSTVNPSGYTVGTPPAANTAYNDTLSSSGNSQLTIGNTANVPSTAQEDIAGNVPASNLGSTTTNLNHPRSSFVSGHYAYVASMGNNELVIDDVSNPSNPTYVSEVSTNLNQPYSVYVLGNFAYVTNWGNNELVVFNISNPTNPFFVGQTGSAFLNDPYQVFVSGRYAYVADYGNNNLVIFDVSNPANPTFVSQIGNNNSINNPMSVFVQGRYAYMTSNGSYDDLLIFDISNPASPTYVGEVGTNLSGGPDYVYVSGSYAYVGTNSPSELVIDNISNPASPVYVGETNTDLNIPSSIYVQGSYAYVGNNGNGELVVDNISNPADPVNIGQTTGPIISGTITTLTVSGRYAYATSFSGNALATFDLGGSYIQQLQVGGTETGTLQVDGNSILSGDASIAGSIAVGGSAEINGNIGSNGLTVTGLATPVAPTVTQVGTAGSTLVGYAVSAFNSTNQTPLSAVTITTTSNANIGISGNSNVISWSPVAGATGYNIYRTYNDGGNPNTTGFIGTVYSSSTLQITDPGMLPSGNSSIPIPTSGTTAFQVQTAGGLNVLAANVATGQVSIDNTLSSLSSPTGLASSTSTTGGTINHNTTYYYVVTAIDSAGGETIPSAEVSQTTGGSTTTNSITLTWNVVSGASGYKVYRGTSPVGENVYFMVPPGSVYNTVSTTSYGGAYVSFTDTGATPNGSATPPSVSTAVLSSDTNMNPSEVHEWQTSGTNSSTTTTTLGDSPYNIGDVIILTTAVPTNTPEIMTVTSGGVASWSPVVLNNGNGTTKRLEMWMGTVTATGSATITVHYSNPPGAYEVTATEFTASGINGSTKWTAQNSNAVSNTGSVTTITYPSLTTQNNSELYFGYGQTSGAYSTGITAGFTYIATPLNDVLAYDTSLANATAYTPTATTTSGEYNSLATILSASTAPNNSLQVTIGANGTPTGQLYVSGTVPTNSLGTTTTNLSSPWSIFVQGSYAYALNNTNPGQVVIFDVSNPSRPAYLSETTGSYLNAADGLYVSGRYAYVASQNNNELVIYNISNPSNPAYVGEVGTNLNGPSSVYISGSYAYVTSENNNQLIIYNISNPVSPTYAGQVAAPGDPQSVYVSGRYAYETGVTNNALWIYDVSNPSNPTFVSTVANTYGYGTYVYVQGNYAYVSGYSTNSQNNLMIFNVSNPVSPTYAGEINAGLNSPQGLYVSGRYAYVTSENNNQLVTIDVSNPSSPVYVGSVGTNLNEPTSVYVQGRYAYVASYGNNTLAIFDLGGAYVQQLQVGGTETGTLQVDGNSNLNGDTYIAGSLAVSSSAQISGNAGLGGLSITDGLTTPAAPTLTVTSAGTTSYGYAVAATNNSGSSAVSGSTTTSSAAATLNTTTAYIESSWSAVTGATAYNVYRTSGGAAQGLIGTVPVSSGTALTPTSGSETCSTSCTLTLSFATPPPYVAGQAINLNGFTMSAGTLSNGYYPILSVTSSTITINVIGGATATITTEGTATGALGFYDTAQVAGTTAPSTATAGTFLLQTTSTAAFQIQNSAGTNVLEADTVNNQVLIGTITTTSASCGGTISGNGVCLSSAAISYAGNARPTEQITLTAEYAGAVLDPTTGANNVGTMTSGIDKSGSGGYKYIDFYNWTTAQATSQNYDVWVQVPVPKDFSAWSSTTPMTILDNSSVTTANSVSVAVYDTTGTQVTQTGGTMIDITPGSTNTWTAKTPTSGNINFSSGTFTASGTFAIDLRLTSPTSGNIKIGTITLTYLRGY
jgi:hypothetical protein